MENKLRGMPKYFAHMDELGFFADGQSESHALDLTTAPVYALYEHQRLAQVLKGELAKQEMYVIPGRSGSSGMSYLHDLAYNAGRNLGKPTLALGCFKQTVNQYTQSYPRRYSVREPSQGSCVASAVGSAFSKFEAIRYPVPGVWSDQLSK